ncbi:hypothetical protein CV716_06875 [Streptococcus thermophilus]|nr:hypothetical protein CV716_06875 [Streptococcus thermophilus]
MFCNSTITDLFLFVFTQLILHYLNVCKCLEIECFKCIICLPCHSNNLLNYFQLFLSSYDFIIGW